MMIMWNVTAFVRGNTWKHKQSKNKQTSKLYWYRYQLSLYVQLWANNLVTTILIKYIYTYLVQPVAVSHCIYE